MGLHVPPNLFVTFYCHILFHFNSFLRGGSPSVLRQDHFHSLQFGLEDAIYPSL